MILQGRFQSGCPVIDIDIPGLTEKVAAILDTGFNGYLMLPQSLVSHLRWNPIGPASCATAGGLSRVEVYEGFIWWMGQEKRIPVLVSTLNIRLIGMDILHACHIEIHRSEGKVIVE